MLWSVCIIFVSSNISHESAGLWFNEISSVMLQFFVNPRIWSSWQLHFLTCCDDCKKALKTLIWKTQLSLHYKPQSSALLVSGHHSTIHLEVLSVTDQPHTHQESLKSTWVPAAWGWTGSLGESANSLLRAPWRVFSCVSPHTVRYSSHSLAVFQEPHD